MPVVDSWVVVSVDVLISWVVEPGVGKTTDNGTMVDNVFPIVRKDNERQRCLNFPKDNEDNGQRFLDFRTTDNVGQLSLFFWTLLSFTFS